MTTPPDSNAHDWVRAGKKISRVKNSRRTDELIVQRYQSVKNLKRLHNQAIKAMYTNKGKIRPFNEEFFHVSMSAILSSGGNSDEPTYEGIR